MTLHVLFTKGGNPGWIGSAPRERSEVEKGGLVGCRRRGESALPEAGTAMIVGARLKGWAALSGDGRCHIV